MDRLPLTEPAHESAEAENWAENMKYLLATAFVIFVASVCSISADVGDDQDTVVDVRVVGNEYMSDEAILHHVKTRVGKRFSQAVANDDEDRLLATQRFETVTVSRTATSEGLVIIVKVDELPVIDSVHFTNNKGLDENKIRKTLPYDMGDPLSDFTIEANIKAIVRLYKDEGYQFVEVTHTTKHRQIIYDIVEGPRISVAKVVYEGNTHFKTWTLNRRVGTHRAWWPFISGPLDLEQVARDVNTLRNLYSDEGYLGAEVSHRLEYNQDKSKVTVVFVIAQHDRYRVNRVVFEGNTVFRDEELARRVTLRQGSFFVALQVRQDTKALSSTYGEVGYIMADIEMKKRYLDPSLPAPPWAASSDGAMALVDVVFRIVERDQYHIRDVLIRGNNVTQEHVVRRLLKFYPEGLVNMVAVGQSIRRLKETRLFDTVSIDPVGGDGNTRDLLVTLTEARTGEFLVGMGVSSREGLLGNISFTQRNFDIAGWRRPQAGGQRFKGAGQTFSIVLEPGTEVMRFKVEWFEPYLFDQPYSLGVKAYMFERARDTYDERRYGPVVSVGHRLRSRWYVELAARIEGIDIRDLDSSAPPEVMSDAGQHWIVGLKNSLIKDRTDSRWMPTTGDRISLSFEQVVGGFNFSKIEGTYRWYRTLWTDAMDRKHYIATKLHVGGIIGDAPVFESFYAGGIGSMRGFEYRGVSPRSAGTSDRIGGEFIVLAAAEYSFPLYGEMFRGVVFMDSGTVEEDFGLSSYRVAAGFGLRWVIPMLGPVPVKLDFAFPLAKDDQDDTQVFSFSLGWYF